MTISLYSIAIFVSDIERAINFYQNDLELDLTKKGSFGAEFMEGGTHIGVHPAVHADAKAMVGRHTGMTFEVVGLLDYCERLHQRKVHFINEPTQQSWGIMAMISDPDGNVMALWENKLPDETAAIEA